VPGRNRIAREYGPTNGPGRQSLQSGPEKPSTICRHIIFSSCSTLCGTLASAKSVFVTANAGKRSLIRPACHTSRAADDDKDYVHNGWMVSAPFAAIAGPDRWLSRTRGRNSVFFPHSLDLDRATLRGRPRHDVLFASIRPRQNAWQMVREENRVRRWSARSGQFLAIMNYFAAFSRSLSCNLAESPGASHHCDDDSNRAESWESDCHGEG